MADDARPRREATEGPQTFENCVSACESRPGRTVFGEEGSSDGRLATGVTDERRR